MDSAEYHTEQAVSPQSLRHPGPSIASHDPVWSHQEILRPLARHAQQPFPFLLSLFRVSRPVRIHRLDERGGSPTSRRSERHARPRQAQQAENAE